jgi:hypothetical protein
MRELLGLGHESSVKTPAQMAKRLEMFVMGSVSPVVDISTAVRFAEVFPVEFVQIITRIYALTGKGFNLVKPPAASQPTTA